MRNKVDKVVLKEYKITKNIRLMEYLLLTFKNKSRNNIKSLLKNRLVLVNGAPVSQFDFELIEGDIIQIAPSRVKETKQKASKLDIIYEDDEFIVINKPSGLLSIASDKEKTITAYRLIQDYVSQNDKHKRIYIVHRIDKETSGVLMFVKNEKLKHLFQDGDNWNSLIKKREYYAVVEGKMEKKDSRIVSYLLESSSNMVYVASSKEGKKAITNYHVEKENDKYSLLNIDIETGRKNQIRVQLASIHHPVVGDDKYLGYQDPFARLGLHAYKLEFIHPINHKTYTFVAKIPKEFLDIFKDNYQEKKKRAIFLKRERRINSIDRKGR